VGDVRDVITCAKFQIEIFMGYDFTGGRIFDFCIDFSMGLTTVQRDCAACDYGVCSDEPCGLALVCTFCFYFLIMLYFAYSFPNNELEARGIE